MTELTNKLLPLKAARTI